MTDINNQKRVDSIEEFEKFKLKSEAHYDKIIITISTFNIVYFGMSLVVPELRGGLKISHVGILLMIQSYCLTLIYYSFVNKASCPSIGSEKP